jgi:hypothetical protein
LPCRGGEPRGQQIDVEPELHDLIVEGASRGVSRSMKDVRESHLVEHLRHEAIARTVPADSSVREEDDSARRGRQSQGSRNLAGRAYRQSELPFSNLIRDRIRHHGPLATRLLYPTPNERNSDIWKAP